MRKNLWHKAGALSITLVLVLLIIIVFTPSFSAVKLSPGTPDKSSVMKTTNIKFSYVNLTIRSTEVLPVDYLKFTINQSSNDLMVAYVMFNLDGTKLSESPVGGFTVTTLTNISTLPYQTEGNYSVLDEETGNTTQYGYGYGNSGTNLTVHYNITYKTHIAGVFYARLFVYTSKHTFASVTSISFTVNEPSPPPSPPSPPPASSNQPPVANAGGPYSGYVDKPITFSGSKSTDDVGVTGYRWDWTNDGVYDTNWSTVAITTHNYSSEGVYTLRLQVKDVGNLTNSTTTTVNVTATTEQFQAPVADAAGPYQGLMYQSIRFDGSGSRGINASIVYYLWAFGDGTYGYNVTTTHAYETAGTFTVVLTVTDSHNLIAIDTTTVTVEEDMNRNGIPDFMDQAIGVNITLADLHSIIVGGSTTYLVDTNHDGVYDTFYDPNTNIKTSVGQQQGKQLIDVNGDGTWDYVYDPAHGTMTPFKQESAGGEFPWMYVGFAVAIVAVIIVIVLLYLRKNFYI